jgi:hypothetical protein
VSLDAEDIRNEKVKVLRSMKQVQMSDVVVGQYRGRGTGKNRQPGYLEDKTVPAGRHVTVLVPVNESRVEHISQCERRIQCAIEQSRPGTTWKSDPNQIDK